jgi:hypothetical protein
MGMRSLLVGKRLPRIIAANPQRDKRLYLAFASHLYLTTDTAHA